MIRTLEANETRLERAARKIERAAQDGQPPDRFLLSIAEDLRVQIHDSEADVARRLLDAVKTDERLTGAVEAVRELREFYGLRQLTVLSSLLLLVLAGLLRARWVLRLASRLQGDLRRIAAAVTSFSAVPFAITAAIAAMGAAEELVLLTLVATSLEPATVALGLIYSYLQSDRPSADLETSASSDTEHGKQPDGRAKSKLQTSTAMRQAQDRLLTELDRLARRGNVNLLIGIGTTGIAIWILASTALGERPEDSDVLTALAPRFLLSLFVEAFSFFFLRLYRSGLEETRFYQNELTNLESRLAAWELTTELKGYAPLILMEKLADTERNFVLQKGESAVSLRQDLGESGGLKAALRDLAPLVRADGGKPANDPHGSLATGAEPKDGAGAKPL